MSKNDKFNHILVACHCRQFLNLISKFVKIAIDFKTKQKDALQHIHTKPQIRGLEKQLWALKLNS